MNICGNVAKLNKVRLQPLNEPVHFPSMTVISFSKNGRFLISHSLSLVRQLHQRSLHLEEQRYVARPGFRKFGRLT